MNMAGILDNAAQRFGEKKAIILDDRSLSFSQLNELANRVGNGLKEIGVQRGDRVSLLLPNSIESISSFYAIMMIGAVINPLNPLFKGREIKYILNHSEARVLTTTLEQMQTIEELRGELPHLDHVVLVGAELAQQFRRAVYAAGKDVGEEIDSWEEVVVFNCVADRAGTYHLTDYRESSYVPWARAMASILQDEAGHLEMGEQGLEVLCRDPLKRQQAQQLIDKWLPRMVRVFGSPKNPRNEYWVRVGLKLHTAGAEQTRFFQSLVPLFGRCGLRIPDLRGKGLELTPEVSQIMAQDCQRCR